MKKHYQGFTFIELMIVIAIVGILLAIAMPAYVNYMNRGYLVEQCKVNNTTATQFAINNQELVETARHSGTVDICPLVIAGIVPDELPTPVPVKTDAELALEKIARLEAHVSELTLQNKLLVETVNQLNAESNRQHKQLSELSVGVHALAVEVDSNSQQIIADNLAEADRNTKIVNGLKLIQQGFLVVPKPTVEDITSAQEPPIGCYDMHANMPCLNANF